MILAVLRSLFLSVAILVVSVSTGLAHTPEHLYEAQHAFHKGGVILSLAWAVAAVMEMVAVCAPSLRKRASSFSVNIAAGSLAWIGSFAMLFNGDPRASIGLTSVAVAYLSMAAHVTVVPLLRPTYDVDATPVAFALGSAQCLFALYLGILTGASPALCGVMAGLLWAVTHDRSHAHSD